MGELIGLIGLASGVWFLRAYPPVRLLAIACALAAAGVGEIVVVLAAASPGANVRWSAVAAYYPLAVLAVGGWAAVLGGVAGLSLRRRRLSGHSTTKWMAALCAPAGAVAGLLFALLLVIERTMSETNASGFLFSTRSLLLAGASGGAAAGLVCAIWTLASSPADGRLPAPDANTAS
jgi:hypothetical protein